VTATLQLELGAHVVTVDEANERLRDALDIRVDAHRRREAGDLSVYEYLNVLAWVRGQEDVLEPIREAAGYTFSRAWELCHVHSDGYKSARGFRGSAR
jgi:hypothetical protein